ncbi:hypothetical protein D3C86_2085270 [compost metagenome]
MSLLKTCSSSGREKSTLMAMASESLRVSTSSTSFSTRVLRSLSGMALMWISSSFRETKKRLPPMLRS